MAHRRKPSQPSVARSNHQTTTRMPSAEKPTPSATPSSDGTRIVSAQSTVCEEEKAGLSQTFLVKNHFSRSSLSNYKHIYSPRNCHGDTLCSIETTMNGEQERAEGQQEAIERKTERCYDNVLNLYLSYIRLACAYRLRYLRTGWSARPSSDGCSSPYSSSCSSHSSSSAVSTLPPCFIRSSLIALCKGGCQD